SADTTCSGPTLTSITLPAGTSSKIFHYQTATSDPVTITATDAAAYLTAGSHLMAGSPRQLFWSGPSSIGSNSCSTFTITARDAGGNPGMVLTDTTINLAHNSSSAAFYDLADTTC